MKDCLKDERSEEDVRKPDEIHREEKNFYDQQIAKGLQDSEETVDIKKRASLLKALGIDERLEGIKILECGCGTGWLTSELAGRGATVTCFDISYESVKKTRSRVEENGVHERVYPQVAAMEELPYKGQSFDLVIGIFILHHTADLKKAAEEIFRVLKPGHKAVFYETSGTNPILMFFRRHLAGRWGIPKMGTQDEHPLTSKDIQNISSVFSAKCDISYPRFRFFGKISFQLFRNHYKMLKYLLQVIDKFVYQCLPFLRRYSFQVMIKLTK